MRGRQYLKKRGHRDHLPGAVAQENFGDGIAQRVVNLVNEDDGFILRGRRITAGFGKPAFIIAVEKFLVARPEIVISQRHGGLPAASIRAESLLYKSRDRALSGCALRALTWRRLWPRLCARRPTGRGRHAGN